MYTDEHRCLKYSTYRCVSEFIRGEFILDPNRFIFQSLENGYFINPTASAGSVVNFGGVQDIRVMTALEGYSNVLLREAELIFEGIAESITYEVSNNIHGKPMIYSNVKIKLTDKIRGEALEDMEYFDLKVVGGKIGEKSLEVKGMPTFVQDEKFVLFLNKREVGYEIVRGEMGKISLSGTVEPIAQKSKWDGLNPIIRYAINPNLFMVSQENLVKYIKRASLEWFLKGKSNIAFHYDGSTEQKYVDKEDSIQCEFKQLDTLGIVHVFASNVLDPDCTSGSCAFLWKCGSQIVNADIQLNAVDYSWILYPSNYVRELTLSNEILHNLGHIAGLEHCAVGDTSGMCMAKLGADWSQLDKEDVMYKFPIFPIGLVGSDEEIEEPEDNKALTSQDISKLQSLYGTLDLPFPTEGKYALSEKDMEDIISYIHFESLSGAYREGGRQKYSQSLVSLIAYNQYRTKKNIQQLYEEFYEKVKRQTSMFNMEQLKIQRMLLTMGVYNGVRIKQDRLNGYHNLDLGFIDDSIQKHLELRKMTIDAIGAKQ